MIDPNLNLNSPAPFHINKTSLPQDQDSIDRLDQGKKDKYVSDQGSKKMNYKAFYKGHDYARTINPEHLNSLNKKTIELLLAIDQKRALEHYISLDVEIKKSKKVLWIKENDQTIPPNTTSPRSTSTKVASDNQYQNL